jgi:hypothetical protein
MLACQLGERGEAGLRFVESCPDDLLLAATLGIDLGPTLLGGPRPESVDDFVWRPPLLEQMLGLLP